jgi:stage V sporulation protein D
MKRVSHVTVRKRLAVLLLFGLSVFFIILLRLGYVQFVMGEELTERAMESWNREIPFEPKRGEILDRNGVVLATNKSAPTVQIIPRQVENPAETARKLAPLLGISEDRVYRYITKKVSIVTIPEGRKLDVDTANQIRDLNLKGVYIAEDFKRHYPFGTFLSHVLGFTGIDNQGLMGLELAYDEELAGTRGSVQFYSTAKGERMKGMPDGYRPSVDGMELVLTIDSRLQQIVERELDLADAKYEPDGLIAIAMDPKTGEILAMASRPTFDPAHYQEVPPEIYNRNLPIWSTYEPGSTFKIITLAAALEEGKVDLDEDHFHDSGSIKVANATLHCWKRGGHGSQTFLEVVENSCNPGFVELGNRVGKEKLFEYIRKFGFGEKTGIDLQGEGKGILFSLENVGPVELATTSFGQGVSVTPIQQVAAVAAAVNGGILYQPYIVKELRNPDSGEILMHKHPAAKRRVISEETSKELRRALESVVAKGTGKNAYVDGYRVGGKTGTAQKAKDGRYLENNHIVSFIGFAPADDPQLVLYVAVDNPKGTIQFGGTVAAPIVGKIMEDALSVMGVERRAEQMEKEWTWPDQPLVEVPQLVGLDKKELRNLYYTFSLEIEGTGNRIVAQAPEAGVKVPEGSTIRIVLE